MSNICLFFKKKMDFIISESCTCKLTRMPINGHNYYFLQESTVFTVAHIVL